jgi:cell division protein FtsW
MMERRRTSVRGPHAPDPPLLAALVGLLAYGLVMLNSASSVVSYQEHGTPTYYFMRQLIAAAAGVCVMIVLMRLDYRLLGRLAIPLHAIAVLLLLAVLVPSLGHRAYGAQRWIAFPGVQLQPSELVKLTMVLYIARWMARKGTQVSDLAYGFVPFLVLLGLVFGLIILQPDMGTAVIVAVGAVAVFFAAGASVPQLVLFSGLSASAAVVLIQSAAYRMQRITAFMDPWKDPQRTGYHTVQALLALGSGGLTGVGLGASRQKFLYLPFPHTDSIFAIVGEELGLIGTLAVLGLFLLLAWRGLVVALRAPDLFGRLLATGLTASLAFQAFLNIAVVTSSVPFTGVTLPFFSYGINSLLVSMTAAGILLSISRRTVPAPSHDGAPQERARRKGLLDAELNDHQPDDHLDDPLDEHRKDRHARPRLRRRHRGAHLPGTGHPASAF